MQTLLILLLVLTSTFLILLIMIQRGKGGGLAGAFGGSGGQSAFGTKAGDTFTKITVWTALFWFALCVATILILKMGGKNVLNMDAGKATIPTSSTTVPTQVPSPIPASSDSPIPASSDSPVPVEQP
ncbi:MAG: preprotein translocase subunit SecG [Thermoguttaceae bacterium]